MKKVDLIQALKDSDHLSRLEPETVLNLFFDQMADALAQGNRVEIRGLCSFFIIKYAGYTGRNLKTGELVKVAQNCLFSRQARSSRSGWMGEIWQDFIK